MGGAVDHPQMKDDMLVLFCRWSEMLSSGPGNLCLESSKAIKHDLWQNQLWLKRKAEAARQADSDEDDTEQFGIQEGNAEGTTAAAELAGAPADDDEADAYPLYGEDDSDFGDLGSDVSVRCWFSWPCISGNIMPPDWSAMFHNVHKVACIELLG
jgi:hypothetical protein